MDDLRREHSDTDLDRLDPAIAAAANALQESQGKDGHWVFELEADATIPAEYIMLNHYLGEIDDRIEQKLAVYLRRVQGDDGGWPLFHDGEMNVSASVKAYFALKLAGDDPDAPHMVRAREAILAAGGAANSNVFTRFALALFEQIPWRATPVSRVEFLLVPSWFPWHIYKMSYWSRTVMVPLLILASVKPKAQNPRNIGIRELFVSPPDKSKFPLPNPHGNWLGKLIIGLDRLANPLQPLIPKFLTRWGIKQALDFIAPRLNGEDGLGGIFPAMANAVMAYDCLGYPRDHPGFVQTRKAIDDLLVEKEDMAYCQPCLSPIWDTALAAHALMEVGNPGSSNAVSQATGWLLDRQVKEARGDWAVRRPDIPSGGWAFQYNNDYYPDVDDTAVVAMALHRADPAGTKDAVDRSAQWVMGMQSKNGGWAAFDADNDYRLLNHIPFADHGALMDPPTADVTARSVSMLCQLGYDRSHPSISRGIDFLLREQEGDGSWFGRWGTNYIYGTWSVLSALNAAGEDPTSPTFTRAVAWLKAQQRSDGGWGEDCSTYWEDQRAVSKASTPSQTSWAVLALMCAGEVESDAVRRGINYLLDERSSDGNWTEQHYNAVGFPKVFYLQYHGYAVYFPLWALARYRNLKSSNSLRPAHGL
ncbi:MAG: squalene--hopene cyclase [Proteobacteria bacterium]|nr:squalene--hopene cyclase [Pseudomonadota bacterium]